MHNLLGDALKWWAKIYGCMCTVHQSFHSKYTIMPRNILFAFQTLRWSEMQIGLMCVVALSGQQYSQTCYSTNFFSTELDFTLFWIGSIITSTVLFFENLLTFYSTILTWFMIERKMSNFFFVVFFSSLINNSVV